MESDTSAQGFQLQPQRGALRVLRERTPRVWAPEAPPRGKSCTSNMTARQNSGAEQQFPATLCPCKPLQLAEESRTLPEREERECRSQPYSSPWKRTACPVWEKLTRAQVSKHGSQGRVVGMGGGDQPAPTHSCQES